MLFRSASLDGRSAAADGSSQWITGLEARADAHGLRADSQAVIVGSGTALADRPSLTARDCEPPAERQPRRVLLDARGRVPAQGPLFDRDLGTERDELLDRFRGCRNAALSRRGFPQDGYLHSRLTCDRRR